MFVPLWIRLYSPEELSLLFHIGVDLLSSCQVVLTGFFYFYRTMGMWKRGVGRFQSHHIDMKGCWQYFFNISRHLKRCIPCEVWLGGLDLVANQHGSILVALEGFIQLQFECRDWGRSFDIIWKVIPCSYYRGKKWFMEKVWVWSEVLEMVSVS